MIQDNSYSSGKAFLVLTGQDGQEKDRFEAKNLIVTSGKIWQTARQKETGRPNEISHLACGTGTNAPAMGDTTLQTELVRVAATSSTNTNVVTYSGTFPAGTGTGALTELGLFNASSGGTLVSRVTFPVVNKGANDTLTVTWTHTQN